MVTIDSASAAELPAEAHVLIAGGGPSGLFLALDLASRGIPSIVIEPRTSVDPARPRAKTTNARTMTHLRRLGLADKLRAAAPLPVDYAQDVIFCTGLTGHELRRFQQAFQLVPGRYGPAPECGQQVPQPVLEEVLRAAASTSTFITLVTGWQVEDVVTEPGVAGVGTTDARSTLRLSDASGRSHTMVSQFVVGADGGSSVVRRSLGIRLDGGSATLSNLSIMFRSKELGPVITLDPAVQYWVVGEQTSGMVGRMDLADTWWAIIQGVEGTPPDATSPDQDAAAVAMVRELVGTDIDVDIVATDPWTARMLLAPSYGRDGVFLVGDAAHLNPPWGGHGFNTCIGDAANLAWKIAASLSGWAGPGLLASYEQERRPVAARTIRDAAANGKALAYHFADPALHSHGRNGPRARQAARQSLAVKASEFDSLGLVLGYAYGESSIVVSDGSALPAEDPIRYTPSAYPGALLRHAWLDHGTSMYDVLGAGFTLLADAAALNGVPASQAYAPVEAAAARQGIPVTIVGVGHSDDGIPMAELWGAPAVLIRPDQHVAWRGDSATAAADALAIATGWTADASQSVSQQRRSLRAVVS